MVSYWGSNYIKCTTNRNENEGPVMQVLLNTDGLKFEAGLTVYTFST